MPEQPTATPERTNDLRASLRSLLDEDLSDQDLRDRMTTLVGSPQGSTAQPTTDDATDHPGYQ
jgi:hypothetical protein